MDLINSLSRAHSVARAFKQLTNDAINCGALPTSMAMTMSKAAKEVARELDQLSANSGHRLSPHHIKVLRNVCIDLEALGDLVTLVLQYDFTTKRALHLALALRYTADRSAEILWRLRDDAENYRGVHFGDTA